MRYLLLIYADEAARPLGDDAMQGMFAEHRALIADMVRCGAYVSSQALQPVAAATAVRRAGASIRAVDGPFAETKEQLAGFYLVECTDLDQAIAFAGRIPDAAWGTIEVRPIWEIGDEIAAEAAHLVMEAGPP